MSVAGAIRHVHIDHLRKGVQSRSTQGKERLCEAESAPTLASDGGSNLAQPDAVPELPGPQPPTPSTTTDEESSPAAVESPSGSAVPTIEEEMPSPEGGAAEVPSRRYLVGGTLSVNIRNLLGLETHRSLVWGGQG